VPKSRRRLLAAGLTAAVIGTTALISTLDAGAEQIPAPPASPAKGAARPAPVTADPEPGPNPPARLPWGRPPTKIDTGKAGASSKSLKATGLDAAAPDTTGKKAAEKYAPKGRTSRNGALTTQQTEVVPPKPPSVGARSAAANPSVHYLYNVGSQAAVTSGAYANFTIARPALATSDYHTLAELAVQSADGNQIVEVGWNVDRVVNGDDDPHLFVFHWINGTPTCYNGCGFVQYSGNISPGDTLPQDTTKRIGVQFYNDAWWIAYDTEWVGYFPASRWNGAFTQTGMIQIFGEVAAVTASPCTEMGNGLSGADATSSAKVGSVTYLNGPAVDMYVRSTSDHYGVAKLSGRTFRYGGAGSC
jgi:hypothetical protein